MKSMMKRTTIREIKMSFGRFFAILAIIALGVGFFSGLKITKPDMMHTVHSYLDENNFFDLHLLSTIGFDDDDIERFAQEADVRYAEGVYTYDCLYTGIGSNEMVLKTLSMPEHINGIRLLSGRLPENASECVIDSRIDSSLAPGTVIKVAETNEKDTLSVMKEREYTVVGLVDSSYYLNFERGTTSIGNGKISGFLYVLPEAFDSEYYTDAFVCFDQDYALYSDEYEDYITEKTAEWEEICAQQIKSRYDRLYSDAQKKLEDARTELEEQKAEGEEKLTDAYQKLTEADQRIQDGWSQLNTAEQTLRDQEAALQAKENELQQQEQAYIQQSQQLQEGIAQLPPEQQAELQQTLETAKAALEAGTAQIADAKAQLERGREQLADQRSQLLQAQTEAQDGWAEYEENQKTYDTEIADAEAQIADGEAELADLTEPDTYVLDRNTNIGYACFESDSEIVNAVAKVFPIFFILVAALVCMTTMNRMVEEQRTQIGVLKALGYSEAVIMSKFMFYSGSAAMLGCVIGYSVGTVVFPKVIWYAYGMMYQSLPLDYVFSWPLAGIALAVSLVCSIGTTWLSCRYELGETAASLMRGRAPKAGKRVFLEYIPWLWKRLKFLHKVSVRNILRYKKRFFMMVIGIGGCTALVLTGFGIEDSIADFAALQYREIQIADGTIGLKHAKGTAEASEEAELDAKLEEVAQTYTYVSESSWDMVSEDAVKSVNLVVMEDPSVIGDYMKLHTEKGEPLAYPESGQAIINNGLAAHYHIEVGDQILVRNEDMQEISVTVAGIFENHVYNYVFLSPDTYTEQLGEKPEYKTIYINYKENQDLHQAAAELMKESQVVSTTLYQDMADRIGNMMSSLDYVVILVIACAAGLAFIVLYNLTNINITERIREIATIKVLGFFRKETEAYVFRENMVLTGVGALLGLGMGVLLHRFVMACIQVDMVYFAVYIRPISYLLSIVITFVFSLLVDRVMSVKLDRINMAESLKSVE